MKKKERLQLKNASVPELEKRVREARARLATVQHDIQLGKHKNVHEAGTLRKDIARMLTEIAAQPLQPKSSKL
jgi:ribosomal protein L29